MTSPNILWSYSVADISCAVATPKTVIRAAEDSDISAELVEFSISFEGTVSTDAPCLVELIKAQDDGTATSGSAENWSDWSGNGSSVPVVEGNFTVEPTVDFVYANWRVTPNGGLLHVQYAPEDRPWMLNGTGAPGFGLRVTAVTNTVEVAAHMVIHAFA